MSRFLFQVNGCKEYAMPRVSRPREGSVASDTQGGPSVPQSRGSSPFYVGPTGRMPVGSPSVDPTTRMNPFGGGGADEALTTMCLSMSLHARTQLRRQNTLESESWRPRHLGLDVRMDGGRKMQQNAARISLNEHCRRTGLRPLRH